MTRDRVTISPIDRGLPKWPQMLTSGAPVTVDQAKEIIRRTDSFFCSRIHGRNGPADVSLAERLRMPYMPYGLLPFRPEFDRDRDRWCEAWGAVSTRCVRNNWISSGYSYGPHGWCWPDGRISYEDNVGKWPSVEDVVADWRALAEVFPFLDLVATLMNGEWCQVGVVPVVTILVRRGRVELTDGDLAHHARYPAPHRRTEEEIDAFLSRVHNATDLSHRRGPIPEAWLDEWAQRRFA